MISDLVPEDPKDFGHYYDMQGKSCDVFGIATIYPMMKSSFSPSSPLKLRSLDIWNSIERNSPRRCSIRYPRSRRSRESGFEQMLWLLNNRSRARLDAPLGKLVDQLTALAIPTKPPEDKDGWKYSRDDWNWIYGAPLGGVSVASEPDQSKQ